MTFTDHLSRVRCLPLALLFSVLLAACASSPTITPDESGIVLPEQGRSPVLPAGPVTANPYLTNPPSVNRDARHRFEQAISAMDAQDWPRAEQLLQSLTRDYPRLSGPFLNLGIVYLKQDQQAAAEAAFQQAVTVNANNLGAWNQLGILKRNAGDFEEAQRYYQQALSVWGFHADSHRHIGILYDLYLGQWQQALDHYRAYQQLLPEPDRQVNGWIVDLERRIAAAGQGDES